MKEFLRNTVLRFPEIYDYFPTFGVKLREAVEGVEVLSCHVVGEDAVIMQEGEIRPDVSSSKAMMRPIAFKYLKYRRYRKINHSWATGETVFFAGGMCSDNYWHMLVEILPLILTFGKGLSILVSEKFKYHDLFNAFGISNDRIIIHKGVHYYGRLKVASVYAMTHAQKIQTLREHCLVLLEPSLTRCKLYISRSDAARRKVVNETEVIKLVTNHGFRTIKMSEHCFSTQVRLFQSAKEIIIPHGAASANLFATPSGAKIIEVMPSFGWSRSTVRICKARGLDYNVVEARTRWGDMLVDLDELEKEIKGT